MKRTIGLTGSILALTLPWAAAQAPEGAIWHMDPPQIWMVDSSDAGNSTDFYSYVQIIRVTNTTGPIVQLACNMNSRGMSSMSAAIQLDPENTYEQDPKRHIRLNTMSGKLTVGDSVKAERWRFHADSTKMIPFNTEVPRRLFNGVVKNAPVALKTRKASYTIDVPEIDSTFKAFAKSCPVTNGGNFDESIFDEAIKREATD